MNWLKFSLLAFIALILQTALLPVVCYDVARPHLLIAMAVFYLLAMRDHNVMIGALILGGLADLSSATPLGCQTIAFGLIAMFIRAARPIVFSDLPAAHAFLGAVSFMMLLMITRLLTMFTPSMPAWPAGLVAPTGQALATGIVSYILCHLVLRRTGMQRIIH